MPGVDTQHQWGIQNFSLVLSNQSCAVKYTYFIYFLYNLLLVLQKATQPKRGSASGKNVRRVLAFFVSIRTAAGVDSLASMVVV
jgi:hypothetical protein